MLEYNPASLNAVATVALLPLVILLTRAGDQGKFHVFKSELFILKKLFSLP
jgi:hypothetical protein